MVGFGLDDRVLDQILAEANGNPLALLELPRWLGPAQLAGGLGLVGAVPAPIEAGFRRWLEALPADTRSLVLVAAAESAGDPLLVWRAAGRLGIPASAAEAAQTDGLLQTGTRVRFRHPLVRSAVYSAASLPERRAAHRALAEVTDRDRDPGRCSQMGRPHIDPQSMPPQHGGPHVPAVQPGIHQIPGLMTRPAPPTSGTQHPPTSRSLSTGCWAAFGGDVRQRF